MIPSFDISSLRASTNAVSTASSTLLRLFAAIHHSALFGLIHLDLVGLPWIRPSFSLCAFVALCEPIFPLSLVQAALGSLETLILTLNALRGCANSWNIAERLLHGMHHAEAPLEPSRSACCMAAGTATRSLDYPDWVGSTQSCLQTPPIPAFLHSSLNKLRVPQRLHLQCRQNARIWLDSRHSSHSSHPSHCRAILGLAPREPATGGR